MKTIEIIVDTKGNSQVETKGFSGAECIKASEFIELALGERNATSKTAEFYNSAVAENNLKNSNGS